MGIEQITVITSEALAGAFVSGFAGFGTGITAISIWLYAVSPPVAASLVVVCSIISRAQTLPAIWRFIEAKRIFPFILAGVVGIPLGTVLLSHLDARILKLGIVGLLLLFSAYMMSGGSRAKITWGGRTADGTIGFGGGILGGLAGLSGPLPTIWATIRGWGKYDSRAVFQAFNVTVLSIALDQPFGPLAVALPIAIMALGSAFQASVGIGQALFAVPLLALVGQSFIPGPMLIAGAILALMTAYRERKAIDVPALRSSLEGLVVGTIAGAGASDSRLARFWARCLAGWCCWSVLLSLTGYRVTATRHSLMIAGAPRVLWEPWSAFMGRRFLWSSKMLSQGLLAGCWAPSFRLLLGSGRRPRGVGLFGVPQMVRTAILLPGVVVGLIVAPHIASYIDGARLRLIILAVAATSALVLLVR